MLAAHTGARWSELTTLHWIDVRTNHPLDDGAISGPGRLRIRPPTPVDQEEEPTSRGRSRSRPGGRTIALDHHAIDALHAHRELVGGRACDLVFTSPGGTRGPAGQLTSANFAVSGSAPSPPPNCSRSGPTGSGRASTTCATPTPSGCWRSRPPIGAIARRLGHANPVVTMRMYQLAATPVHEGQLTTRSLGLSTRWSRKQPGWPSTQPDSGHAASFKRV